MSKKRRKQDSFTPPPLPTRYHLRILSFRRRLLHDFAECVHPGARSYSEVPKSLKNVVCWLGRSLKMTGIWFLREIQDSAVFYN